MGHAARFARKQKQQGGGEAALPPPTITDSQCRRVMIGIPTLGYQTTSGLLDFMFATGMLSGFQRGGIEFVPKIINGTSPISYPVELMRNVIRHHFLQTSCDDLWFVDSDVMPSANSMLLFDVKGADMVAGLYPIPNSDPTFERTLVWSVYKGFGEKYEAIPVGPHDREVIDIDAAGTGCLIIPRRVLEDERLLVDKEWGAMFRTPRAPNGKCLWTDDLDFCHRARALGYTFKAHTAVRWGHIKISNVEDQFKGLVAAFQAGHTFYEEEKEKQKEMEPLIQMVSR